MSADINSAPASAPLRKICPVNAETNAASLVQKLANLLENHAIDYFSSASLLPLSAAEYHAWQESRPKNAFSFTDANCALILRTSGSTTGNGKFVGLTVANLRSSALATQEFLGGPGYWFVCLPLWHIAGLQMLVRSILAEKSPFLAQMPHFTADEFAVQAQNFFACVKEQRAAENPRTYISLVPTQLQRCLDNEQATALLQKFSAILVGGSATSPALLNKAYAAGLRIVTTYGMTETAGGCIYDGLPLPGASVRLENKRIVIKGPMVASAGYLEANGQILSSAQTSQDPDASFFVGREANREIYTTDAGALIPISSAAAAPIGEMTCPAGAKENIEGARASVAHIGMETSIAAKYKLQVLGRLDWAITTGGETISPLATENEILRILAADIKEICVLGLQDEAWGQIVTAVVTIASGSQLENCSETQILEILRDKLGTDSQLSKPHWPKKVVTIAQLPLLANGKIDRAHLAQVLERKQQPETPNAERRK